MLELIGKKIGMSHMFKDSGTMVPLTMVQLYDNVVLDVAVNEDKDFNSLSVAFEKLEKAKNISKSIAGVFAKKSIPLHKKIRNSRVKKASEFKAGESIAIDSVLKEYPGEVKYIKREKAEIPVGFLPEVEMVEKEVWLLGINLKSPLVRDETELKSMEIFITRDKGELIIKSMASGTI